MTNSEFALTYYSAAKKATSGTGLFPETLIVQAILESASGSSYLTKKANNFFGIKAGSNYPGETITLNTKEFLNNKWITIKDEFRAYNSAKDSFIDWVSFLQKNKRYSNVFEAKTPIDQLKEIKKAGYATDPNYNDKTASIFNKLSNVFETASTAIKNNPGKTIFTATAILLILDSGKGNSKI